VVATLALLSISSLAAMTLALWGANLQSDVPAGWPVSGCLNASAEGLGADVVVGHASLCVADGRTHATVDLDNLEPNARYVEWVTYFADASLCDPGPLRSNTYTSNRPCALADVGQVAPRIVHALARRMADGGGAFRVDGSVLGIEPAPHSYIWLLVAPPQWSPVAEPSYGLIQDNTVTPVARAAFDIP
jgi:hypothetical protein